MINLFISLYNSDNKVRCVEFYDCLKNNINNRSINKIFILNEGFNIDIFHSPKIINIPFNKRPMFSDFYNYFEDNAINIIANNDIKFDSSLRKLKYYFLKEGDVLSLTRHEKDGSLFRAVYGDSQDAWVFKGKPRLLLTCHFFMGKLGCDNFINYIFFKGGYRVLNPSKSIRIHHEHSSNHRTYSEAERIKETYVLSNPINYIEFQFIRFFYFYINKKSTLKIIQIEK
jgi:hypothetical protein